MSTHHAQRNDPVTLDVLLVGPFPDDPSLIKGGVQASVYGLARTLLTRSDIGQVKVLSTAADAIGGRVHSRVVDGIDVTYLTAPGKFLLSSIVHVPRILRCLRELPNPIVHLHGTGLLQSALISILRQRHLPFVWTLHGIMAKELRQLQAERPSLGNRGRTLIYSALERWSLRTAAEIIVDTPYVRDAVAGDGKDICVIPQGIFTEEFAQLAGTPREEPLVVAIGVLDPRKGHALTVEAFARVRERVPQARLVIAGARTDAEYARLLHEHVEALSLATHVEIRADLPRSEIVSLLSRARVAALHSREESQGIALCEALAAGVPVVATRVGGIPHVVAHGRDGFLVEYGDIDGFADAIIRLLTSETLRAAMVAEARRSAERFDWNTVTRRIVDRYHRAVAVTASELGSRPGMLVGT